MKIIVSRRVGDSMLQFEVEGSDERDALEKASRFTDSSKKGNLPEACGFCASKSLLLTSYRTKEKNFLYIKIRCKDCSAYSQLGATTSGSEAYYWKQWEKFDKTTNKTTKLDAPNESKFAPKQSYGGER